VNYNRLGNSDITVSELCMGTWAMSGKGHWGAADDETSLAALRAAHEAGVNFFDTADGYGGGHAETLLPRAFGTKLDEIVVATKVGWAPKDPSKEMDHSRAAIVACCEDSLRRLGRECVDLLYLHVYDEVTPVAETAAGLRDLLDAGKARAVGLSNFPLNYMQAVHAQVELVAYQPAYNLLDRDIEGSGHLPWCQQHGMTIVSYSATALGWLTGKFHRGAELPTDFRAGRRVFSAEHIERTRPEMTRFAAIAAAQGKTAAQLAIRWVAEHERCVPIFGARTPQQVVDDVGAAGWRLDAETMNELEELFEA
jgi:aryl-alcohol dehydrogenase-like predicted oxidoreductase